MNTFDLSLDLDKRSGVTQWVTLRQGDKNGTELRATIYDHGVQVGGGYSCRVSIRHPGTGETYYRETANFASGVATVTIDEQYAAAVVGITSGYFELLQGSAVIASTADFGVRILRSATDGAVPGEVYDSAIEDALAELDEATGRISQMVVDATEEYLEAHPELTTTVEDNSLTDAKLIQHGGILDRVARLMYRLDNLLTATPAESDALTVTDAAQTPLAGLALYGRSTQDGTPTPSAPVPIESVTPNLLDYLTNYTASAVRLEDGKLLNTVTDSKTYATPVFQTYLNGTVQETLYIASSNVTRRGVYGRAFTTTKAFDRVRIKHNGSSRDIVLFDQTLSGGAGEDYYVTLKVYAYNPSVVGGLSVGDIALYEGSAARDYAPYDSVALLACGRNMLDLSAKTANVYEYGITWTVNGDGTVTARGTATGTAQVYWAFPADELQRFGGMVLSGCPSASGCSVRLERGSSPYTVYAADTGSGATITFPPEGAMGGNLICRVNSGATVDVTFRPMIRQAGTSAEWEPYRAVMLPIPLQGHTLRSLPDGTRDEVTVDQYGHAVLVQRVGVVTYGSDTATSDVWSVASANNGRIVLLTLYARPITDSGEPSACVSSTLLPTMTHLQTNAGEMGCSLWPNITTPTQTRTSLITGDTSITSKALAVAWLAEHPVTIQYPLAEPVTIDLGTVDPVALQGPDMTAQAVPTAPFALTYERDLNVTLARLEASIADAATS